MFKQRPKALDELFSGVWKKINQKMAPGMRS
jgi:hypothetical protein